MTNPSTAHDALGTTPRAATPIDRVVEIQRYFNAPENQGNFQFPIPESAYTWQNVGRLFHTVDVLRGGPVAELPLALDESIGRIAFEKGQTSETVDSHLDDYPVDAFLVAHRGEIVFERYNTMRPQDKHIWFSASKQCGSTIMALLEEQGLIDVKKPVPAYLPELAGSAWDETTVEDVLDMANGLDSTEHDEPAQDTRTNPDRVYFQWGVTIGMFVNPDQEERDPFAVLRGMQRKYPGHTAFEYNSINPYVMNRINERLTGMPTNVLLSDLIWSKIGAEHDMQLGISTQGHPMLFGFASSTLRDMARYGMIFTPSWNKVSEERIVSESILRMLQTTGDPSIYGKGYVGKEMERNFPDDRGITNRYQWDAVFTDGDLYKGGIGGQGLYVSPSRDLVINWFSTSDGTNQEETMARAIAKTFPMN